MEEEEGKEEEKGVKNEKERVRRTFNGELWSEIATRPATWRTVKGQITVMYISRRCSPRISNHLPHKRIYIYIPLT